MRRIVIVFLLLSAALAGCSSEKERGQYRNLDKPQADQKDKDKDK